jgi:excisionase family DNA binding protein
MSRFLTVPEVAERLRVWTWYVHDLVRTDGLPAFRLGPRGRLLFDPDEFDAAVGRTPNASPGSAAPAAAVCGGST